MKPTDQQIFDLSFDFFEHRVMGSGGQYVTTSIQAKNDLTQGLLGFARAAIALASSSPVDETDVMTRGWEVFHRDDTGFVEIQAVEETGRFATDDEAIEHVVTTPAAARSCIEQLIGRHDSLCLQVRASQALSPS